MKLKVYAVELDTSIQCRASIDTAVVNDYAERMKTGDEFPPIEVYGAKTKCWIGDGWHRLLAARQNGADTIAAKLTAGGRVDALKHALGANALHGHRRSNADKRRSVEIALREFPKLSSRAVAKLCGVSPALVDVARPTALPDSGNATRTTSDGRQYPAKREPAAIRPTPPSTNTTTEAGASMEPKKDETPMPPQDVKRNPHLWKRPAVDVAGQTTRAIESVESMVEVLKGSDDLVGVTPANASAWANRLRKCRTEITRFIARCEEVR